MGMEIDKYKEQLARIIHMEDLHDGIRAALSEEDTAYDKLVELDDAIQELKTYYYGPQWKEDFDAEKNDLFPHNLKRGILAEDTLYDLLGDVDQVLEEKDRPLKPGDKDSEGNIFCGTCEMEIDGTKYIIDSFQSKDARETVSNKIKRLLIEHIDEIN